MFFSPLGGTKSKSGCEERFEESAHGPGGDWGLGSFRSASSYRETRDPFRPAILTSLSISGNFP